MKRIFWPPLRMKVEGGPSFSDVDEKNLTALLDAFGSMVCSLEDIASAYCQADRDICVTAQILLSNNSATANSPHDDAGGGCQSLNNLGEPHNNNNNNNAKKAKQKRGGSSSTSIGTVAGLIGREYVTPKVRFNGSRESAKPVMLNADEQKDVGSTSKNEPMKSDMEEFLYKMLGNGYQLEMSVIHDVIGQCGYDVQMSIDKLLDMSAASLDKSDDVIGIASGNTEENSLGLESGSFGVQSEPIDVSGSSNNDIHSRDEKKKKKDLEREILESIWTAPNRIEEKQEPTIPFRRPRLPYGRPVAKPLDETIIKDFTFITREPVNSRNDEANESSYESLRKAVMEYWLSMKQYYKAAVDAFTENDYEKAQRYMEEGNIFMKKAREADEESSRKLIDNSDEEEELTLNLYELGPKEALSHLKLSLTCFSNLPSIPNVKVVVRKINEKETKDDGRRKRLITKLLEKEGIPWTEEGDGRIIVIQVNEIDPSKFSFANK